jgi:hypothetical protein
MKSNVQLQRHLNLEEPGHPVPPAQLEPSIASSSHTAPPSDVVLSALNRITDQLQSMKTEMTERFQSFDERFQAKVEQFNINVETSLRYLVIKCCVTFFFFFFKLF